MRTLVLLLMVALLPLRMWAADGMAVRMAQVPAVAEAGASAMASMPDDCPMMAKAQAGHEPGDAPAPSATHCETCHLCAASACLPGLAFGQGPVPTGPPSTGVARFAQADLAPDLRPPIA